MIEIVLLAVYIGLSSAAMTVLMRAAPLVHRWVFEQKKPWACDVCMTLWTSLIVTTGIGYWHNPRAPIAWLPGYAIGKFVLAKLSDPMSLPPVPFLEDSAEREKIHES